MNREQLLAVTTAHEPVQAERFGVQTLVLVDSHARDTAGAGSDVDVLVRFKGSATSARYFGVPF